MRRKSRCRAVVIGILAACLLNLSGAEAVEGVSLMPKTAGHIRSDFKFMVAGGESREMEIPIPFYVIRHPRGIVLFDSGLGKSFREQVSGWWANRLWESLVPSEFRDAETAVDQLREMGVGPDDVKYIVVSHLHYDHAGGLRDFPKATVVVTQAEWDYSNVSRWKARLRGVMREQIEGLENRLWLIDFQQGTAFESFESSFDLFGDGALILLPSAGHTPGHQSLLVTTGSGRRVLLTGDAVWVRENYQRPAPKSWLVRHLEEFSADLAWETTLRIREFAERNPDVLIVPGHDPEVLEGLPAEIN